MSSVVRNNLMSKSGYRPYCGNDSCKSMLRTVFYKGQFHCGICLWHSTYEETFIATWQVLHDIDDPAVKEFRIAGVNPFSNNLTDEQKRAVVAELKINPTMFYLLVLVSHQLKTLSGINEDQ